MCLPVNTNFVPYSGAGWLVIIVDPSPKSKRVVRFDKTGRERVPFLCLSRRTVSKPWVMTVSDPTDAHVTLIPTSLTKNRVSSPTKILS